MSVSSVSIFLTTLFIVSSTCFLGLPKISIITLTFIIGLTLYNNYLSFSLDHHSFPGLQTLQGLYPLSSASSLLLKQTKFSSFIFLAHTHEGLWYLSEFLLPTYLQSSSLFTSLLSFTSSLIFSSTPPYS